MKKQTGLKKLCINKFTISRLNNLYMIIGGSGMGDTVTSESPTLRPTKGKSKDRKCE